MSTSPRRPYQRGDLRATLVTATRALLVAEGLALRRGAHRTTPGERSDALAGAVMALVDAGLAAR